MSVVVLIIITIPIVRYLNRIMDQCTIKHCEFSFTFTHLELQFQ